MGLYLFYNIAQRNIKKEIFRRFRVDIELYQHGSQPISVQNLQMLYYNIFYNAFKLPPFVLPFSLRNALFFCSSVLNVHAPLIDGAITGGISDTAMLNFQQVLV